MSDVAEFPIPLNEYTAIALDPKQATLTAEQRETLKKNIEICRDAIIFFTAIADAKGLPDTLAVLTTRSLKCASCTPL